MPYLAPQAANSSKEDGHRYVYVLWPELGTFIPPAGFPYNNTFRLAFNATRVAAEALVAEPILADWFIYEANATKAGGHLYPSKTATEYKGKYAPTPKSRYRL